MRVLSAIVLTQPARSMTIDESQPIWRGATGPQSVGDDSLGLTVPLLMVWRHAASDHQMVLLMVHAARHHTDETQST